MSYSIACKDAGVDCDWTGHAKTEEDLMVALAKHAKEVHNYTDEQLEDPELIEKIKSLVKTD